MWVSSTDGVIPALRLWDGHLRLRNHTVPPFSITFSAIQRTGGLDWNTSE